MIRSDRVLDPALQELKMIKRLRINKYKVNFTEFAVAWVISHQHESCKICKNFKIMWMAQILTILPVGIENLGKLAWNAQISHSSGQGSVDFVQYAVNFESSIYHGANRKMVCKFCIICANGGPFDYLGGVHGFLTAHMCANGTDFMSFII